LMLIGLMFVIFFAQEVFGPDWYLDLMAVPADLVESWQHLLAGKASAGDWKQFGSMLSCAFLHGSFEHITSNMLFFWIFGALIVELVGWRWMLGLFVITAIAASAVHTAMNREELAPMLGASGAVMGFEGAYLGLAVRWRLPAPHIWPMARPISPGQLALLAVVGVCFDYFSLMAGGEDRIAYGAHVGGFTMGLMLASTVMPKPRGAWAGR
jgi:membrane associated rhomboid family serine protease